MTATRTMSQQAFLQHAMQQLQMTRAQFADRIGAPEKSLDLWLLPSESKSHKVMDDMAWKFIREILQNANIEH